MSSKVVVALAVQWPEENTPTLSQKSKRSLEFVLRRHHQQDLELFMYHVFTSSLTDYRLLDKRTEAITEVMRATLLNSLNDLKTKGITPRVSEVHRRVSHGKVLQEVEKLVNGIQPDWIAIGLPKKLQLASLYKLGCGVYVQP